MKPHLLDKLTIPNLRDELRDILRDNHFESSVLTEVFDKIDKKRKCSLCP